jgi:hypothetical protein
MAHTHQHFIYTYTPDGFADDDPVMVEMDTHTHLNPFESDDPEVAYHEYLAERFSR